MNDSEVREILLRVFYEKRKENFIPINEKNFGDQYPISEIYRILKKECVVRITDDNNDNDPYKTPYLHKSALGPVSPSIIQLILLEAGFKVPKQNLRQNETYSKFKDICVDNHSQLGDGRFFIEGIKHG